jgi:2'-5' RNA ligase
MSSHLYFMHFPEAAEARKIGCLANLLAHDYALKRKPFAPDRLHSTLQDLGPHVDVPDELVARAKDAAAMVAAPPFDVVFDRVATFSGGPGDRPVVLRGGDGIICLQRAIGAAMTKAGLGAFVNRSFTPHITLLRGSGVVEEQTVQAFRWTVRDFALVNSLVGQGKYVVLGQWSLRG